MMNNVKQAFTETIDIVKHMDKECAKKIPQAFLNILEENKDSKYKVKIDYSKGINEQNILHETRVILSIIYRDYICSAEDKRKFFAMDRKIIKRNEQKKYNPDNLFKKKEIVKEETAEKNECKELIEYKEENFIKRILRKIISLFKK